MAQEPEILYKLMVLYMLDQVSFPLTNTQLSDFFLDKDYTTYFTLQQVINGLEESGFIRSRQMNNTTHYYITDDGKATLRFFSSEMSQAVIQDMNEYLQQNKFRMRSEVSITADYYRPEGGDYRVNCRIHEGMEDILSLELAVPDEKTAEIITANWKARAQAVYQNLMTSLT